MQAIDLNAELERLHESLQSSKSDNAAMNIIDLIREVYELYREQERDSDAEIFDYIKQGDETEETERAAPAIKEMIEKEIDWAREFEVLLCSMDCWDKYEAAYSSSRMIHNPESVADFLATIKPDRYLGSAFGWHKTRQGEDFWYHLDTKWQRRILELRGFQND